MGSVYSSDLTASQTYSASTYLNTSFTADKAFNNNESDGWICNGTLPQWLQITFSSAKTIKKLRLTGYNGYQGIKNFKFQVYSGGTWVDIYSGTAVPNVVQWNEYTFSNAYSSTQYRIYVTASYAVSSSNTDVYITEVEMMEYYGDITAYGTKRTTLNSLTVGDYIECEYTALSGGVGIFTNLGSATKGEISLTPPLEPDGKFNFICVERKAGKGGLCIADRILQSSICWDGLNAAGVIEGRTSNYNNTIYNADITTGACGIQYHPTTAQDVTYAFDNSMSTSWAPYNYVPGSTWVGQDFGVAKAVYKVGIADDSTGFGFKSFVVEASNDNFTTIGFTQTFTNTTVSPYPNFKYVNLTNTSSYRYWRVRPTSGYTSGTAIREIEMWALTSDSVLPVGTLIRSISGGVDYANYNNQLGSSTPNKAYPTNNEWDKYIINSTLNGKITASDNYVWNSTDYNTLCKDTISSTWGGTGDIKTTRKKTNSDPITWTRNTDVGAGFGFRPVLEWNEDSNVFL